MDVKKAIELTVPYIKYSDLSTLPSKNDEYGVDHLLHMCNQVMTWDVTDRKIELKAHRWLGYIQGVLVSNGAATLEEMKKINMIA